MARPKQEQDTLASVSGLEKLAASYDKTAKTLKKLARSLRNVLAQAQTLPAEKVPAKRKTRKSPATPKKRKKMSPAQKKAISDRMKAKWAARKAAAA